LFYYVSLNPSLHTLYGSSVFKNAYGHSTGCSGSSLNVPHSVPVPNINCYSLSLFLSSVLSHTNEYSFSIDLQVLRWLTNLQISYILSTSFCPTYVCSSTRLYHLCSTRTKPGLLCFSIETTIFSPSCYYGTKKCYIFHCIIDPS